MTGCRSLKHMSIPYDTPVSYSQDKPLSFSDFELTYKAAKVGQDSIFMVLPKSGDSQELNIPSGQLAPQPKSFKVNNKNFTLYTHMTPDKILLDRNMLMIKSE
jgi:hypothetical protein